MKRVAANPEFRFHPGCKTVGLNCLIFADDILVFSNAHEHSVHLIAEALQEFDGVAGLATSPSKSRIYAGGAKWRISGLTATSQDLHWGKFP